jgi:5-methyltetrahydropteroyltriglutamate--homocysteine methyltransferase
LEGPRPVCTLAVHTEEDVVALRTTPPFRADHVGSLLRPERLHQARSDHAAGKIDDAELRGIEDECIREVVQMQENVGLRSATDGEFRRSSWHMDFIYQLGGVTTVEGNITVKFRNPEGGIEFRPAALRVNERVTLPEPIFADHFRFLQDTVTTAVPKLTIPSPSMIHYRGGRASIDESIYPDMDAFWDDLTSAYAAQVSALGEMGCTYLQFDDTSLAYLNDPDQREHVRRMGGDAEHQHEAYIRNINKAIAGRPQRMAITTHMCRGNFQSSWVAEGGYDFVAEALFGELDVDGFFMEWDDERSGGFEPLRFVPPGKTVVLGLVTTKRGDLESADNLKRRIEEASRYVDIEQLCLSPQCGFASTVEGNKLTYDEEVAKLSRIVEVAQDVWG